MKLISGHKYLRGANGEVVPFSDSLAKASGYEMFVQEGDFENDLQLPENQKVVARKPIPRPQQQQDAQPAKVAAKKPAQPVKPQPVVKQTFEDGHMDIRDDMNKDLEGLE